MLDADTKQTIQTAYTQFLKSRNLTARLGQKQMIAEIAKTLGSIHQNDEGHRDQGNHICVVEAGTGTGKTVAYFLSALPIAKALKKHLVVSTATVALQEQIVHKDLPDIRDSSGLDFSYSIAKGRGRYVCLAKLDRHLNEFEAPQTLAMGVGVEGFSNPGEQTIQLYQSMLEAMSAKRWDGDRDNWHLALEDFQWQPITTNHRECTGRRCSYVNNCSFFKSREQIQGVDCIVTNHDLVLADLALGGGAILPAPEDTIYVFDEAHHLADKALSHFSHFSRIEATLRWLDEVKQSIASVAQQIGKVGDLQRRLQQLPTLLQECRSQLIAIQPILLDCLENPTSDEQGTKRYRFAHGIVPASITELAGEATQCFGRLVDALTQISNELASALADGDNAVPVVDMEAWYPVIGSWLLRMEANLALWMSFSTNDVGEIPEARWLEKTENQNGVEITIASSPILAAHTLEEILWSRCYGAVLTSATLTALGTFDRLKQRSGTGAAASYHVVPSPFSYREAYLHIPNDAADAGDATTHTEYLINVLPEILDEGEGSLVLFSSRRQMSDVFDRLPGEWRDRILLQGTSSKQELLLTHKTEIEARRGSVIFGLASFAEGIDLPGRYCQHVVIAKIPFAVPNDPIEEGLAEWIKERGGNPFMEISVPDASLKLIQACGRLIRTETDTGKISILDGRLRTRRYGSAILKSLPPFQRR